MTIWMSQDTTVDASDTPTQPNYNRRYQRDIERESEFVDDQRPLLERFTLMVAPRCDRIPIHNRNKSRLVSFDSKHCVISWTLSL